MLRINFFGDFKCNDIGKLSFNTTMKALLDEADINVLNFEAPVKIENARPIIKFGPCLSQDPAAPAFLETNGFNIVSLANNHIADFGDEALLATVNSFRHSCGAGTWRKAYEPEILDLHGLKIGFIGLSHHEFGVLDERLYSPDKLGAAWMLHPCVDNIISKAKTQCDLLYIIPHAGMENEDMPLPEICTLYRHWIDMGVDGVIASHPHTPQPWEIYNEKPIFYSLGNLCFDSLIENTPQYWHISLAACLSINDDGKVGIRCIPCFYDQNCGRLSEIHDNYTVQAHMKSIMGIFSDKENYKRSIDDMCRRYIYQYENSAKIAGYQRMSFSHCLRWMGGRMRGKGKTFNITPLLNDFTCETHRWMITRILSLNLENL